MTKGRRGWPVVSLRSPAACGRFFPAPEVTAAIVARAGQLRGQLVGDQGDDRIHARGMLADARAVLLPGEAGVPWAVLAGRLAELAPEFYAGVTADMVRESLARYGVTTQDAKVGGKNAKVALRTALDAAAQRREIEAE